MSLASTIGDGVRPRFRFNRSLLLIGLIYVGLIFTVIYPIALILIEAVAGGEGLGLAKVVNTLTSPDVLRATWDTIWMSILAVIMAAVVGVTLAWLVAQPGVTAPIASATSVEQVHALARGVRLKLGGADILELTAAGR